MRQTVRNEDWLRRHVTSIVKEVPACKGPRGLKGDQGPQGIPGQNGRRGPRGFGKNELEQLYKQLSQLRSEVRSLQHFRALFSRKEIERRIEEQKARKRTAGTRREFRVGGVNFAVRWIPAGSFKMGSPENEQGRYINEGPQRRVRISQGFWMMESEVTQGQWKALMGSNPSHFNRCGDNCPVEQVSWHDARAFANKLSEAQGFRACTDTDSDIFRCKGWRLPTEAEWEYAARAGETKAFHTGDCISTKEGNYDGNYPHSGCELGEYRQKTIAACSLARNAWGLCDVHGNVWEWTMDVDSALYRENKKRIDPLYTCGSKHMIRGGGWYNIGRDIRFANRSISQEVETKGTSGIGFRLLKY